MKIILSILALLLLVVVHIVDIFYLMFSDVKGKKWYQLINKRHFQKAFNIDVFGNYQYRQLWNALLSKGGYEFGRFGETISSCLGKKQQEKSLSIAGWILVFIINAIDIPNWFNDGHCIASIQTDEEIDIFIKK